MTKTIDESAVAEGVPGKLPELRERFVDILTSYRSGNNPHWDVANIMTKAVESWVISLPATKTKKLPSDDEIYELALKGGFLVDTGDGFSCMVQDEVEFAHAVLARWGQPPAPPAEGEVAELVDTCIATYAEDPAIVSSGSFMLIDDGKARDALLTRAAELLERAMPVHPLEKTMPEPVAVSERLPGTEDLDSDGRCWWFLPTQQFEMLHHLDAWSFRKHTPRKDDYYRYTHWLPANYLPVPETKNSVSQ